jgi:2-oxoglutarate ferredoxin oxidoreductase subunit alpha
MILSDGVLGQMMEPFVPVEYNPPEDLPPKDWVLDGCEGRQPRVVKSLFMGEGQLEQRNYKLKEKYDRMRAQEVLYEAVGTEDAEVLLVAFGVAARVCLSAQRQLRKEGIPAGLFRPVSLFPFPETELREAARGKKVLVVEMNLGQMVEDVKLSVDNPQDVEFYGRPGGAIITPEEVLQQVKTCLQGVSSGG